MNVPDVIRLFEAVDATWPAARVIQTDHWELRAGQGGGKRVSAATASADGAETHIAEAERDMAALTQSSLFMVRGGEEALDTALAARDYAIVDPVVMLCAPVADLTDQYVPRLRTFTIWEPLAIMKEIWAQGGIGPARLDVMQRAADKTAILARWNQRPAGVGFVARDRDIAMVHAVEVLPAHRRQGVAQWIMRQAAFWAAAQGAETIAVLCTKANTPALALYSGLGFAPAGEYHYRQKTEAGD